MARVTVISDLHLHPGANRVTELFEKLLEELAARQASDHAQHLYVAGDLFSFWVDRPLAAQLFRRPLEALHRLADTGCEITLLEGNRDFGFGRVLLNATGARLNGEVCNLVQNGEQALLMHGDQLLTADRRYQLFKRLVRSWPARLAARYAPSPLLLWSVRRLEGVSTREKAIKQPEVMKVDDASAARQLGNGAASILIHGHIHEPGERIIEVSGRRLRLFSLGEWSAQGAVILDWPENQTPVLKFWNGALNQQPAAPPSR